MKKQRVIKFLERLESEEDCFLPQNYVISDFDYRIPQGSEAQIFISVQKGGNTELTYTFEVSPGDVDEMMSRLKERTSGLV